MKTDEKATERLRQLLNSNFIDSKQKIEISYKMKCGSCGKENSGTANFCKYCGKKMKETCSYCWVRKKDNYNCGKSNCPGYNLFRVEKSKTE